MQWIFFRQDFFPKLQTMFLWACFSYFFLISFIPGPRRWHSGAEVLFRYVRCCRSCLCFRIIARRRAKATLFPADGTNPPGALAAQAMSAVMEDISIILAAGLHLSNSQQPMKPPLYPEWIRRQPRTKKTEFSKMQIYSEKPYFWEVFLGGPPPPKILLTESPQLSPDFWSPFETLKPCKIIDF